MKFNKTTTEFALYSIDKDFLAFLKTKDENVIDANICNTYCGPVFTENNLSFYAPVLPEQKSENEEEILTDFANGKLAYLDFNKMIPCQTKFLTKIKESSQQKDFCLNNRDLIERCAEKQRYK